MLEVRSRCPWLSGLGITPGHLAHREPAPHEVVGVALDFDEHLAEQLSAVGLVPAAVQRGPVGVRPVERRAYVADACRRA